MTNNYFILKSGLTRWFLCLTILVGLLTTNLNAADISSQPSGGLWNNTGTWVGGVIPTGADAVTIVPGSVVTVDVVVAVAKLTVDGLLQWNATSNTMTIASNLVVNATGSFMPYTATTPAAVTVNIGGNFTNNGSANCALATLVFNGGVGQTISSNGPSNFIGNGTDGIIRVLQMVNTTTLTISTTQNLVLTSTLNDFSGQIITNGKLFIDNTAQVYGQNLNLRVANIALGTMGNYSVAPVVFGATATPYANALAASVNTRYFNGNNVYLCTSTTSPNSATFNALPPTHTSGIQNSSGPALLWIGTLGTLGAPFQATAVTLGNQYY